MQDKIQDKLYADVEGTCSGRYGYVVTVVSVSRLEKGKVLPGSGLAEFKVSYQAILFKPFKGEVLDGLVTTVNKLIPNEFKFDVNGNPPCYSSEDQVIQKDVRVRLKLVGTRVDATEIVSYEN
ncbi:hypothetical protein G6F22_000542 [Rhizopus arrhizus]|nr:hypothetical protein G6F22_000542 [Rhizopus arrhizus]